MNIQKEIYEFSASAGALEGFVFMKEELDPKSIEKWVQNLVKQYHNLPDDVRSCIQSGLDRTLGRAVYSIIPTMGEDHPHTLALQSIIKGDLPESSRDFEKEKEKKADL